MSDPQGIDAQPLDDAQRERLRRKMQHELAALGAEIQTLRELTRPVAPDRSIGRLSRLEAIAEKGVNEAALRSAEARCQRISRALQRIDEDDFGHCVRCARPIPFARMMAVPDVRLCVDCAERDER